MLAAWAITHLAGKSWTYVLPLPPNIHRFGEGTCNAGYLDLRNQKESHTPSSVYFTACKSPRSS